jgi:diguanylate cyclase (GGDEF)-like protein
MKTASPRPPFVWLLGRTQLQRRILTYWVEVNSVYVLLLALQWYAVSVDMASTRDAAWITAYLACIAAAFYGVVRSGWSAKFADPALTGVQMVFGLVVVAMAYLANPQFHGMMLTIVAMVLIIGALTLTPRNCRLMGLFSLAGLGITILIGQATRPIDFDAQQQMVLFTFALITLPCIAELAARLSAMRNQLREQKRTLKEAMTQIQRLAARDELTGLFNRRHALELLGQAERRNLRRKSETCIAMIDLDHFKEVNDTHGHSAGDDVLRSFAQQASSVLRDTDMLARWGGEEFLLLMPDTSPDKAEQVIDRFRDLFSRAGHWPWQPDLCVTFSVGLTVHRAGEAMENTVARADAALYRAKAEGRNLTISQMGQLT